jgi:hypothetical protein
MGTAEDSLRVGGVVVESAAALDRPAVSGVEDSFVVLTRRNTNEARERLW